MRLVLLVVVGCTLGCGDHDAILNQIHQHNAGYTDDEPIGEFSTGGSGGDTESATTTGAPPVPTPDLASDPQFGVRLVASHTSIDHVGTVTLTAEVLGLFPVDSMTLFASSHEGPKLEFEWTPGEPFDFRVGPTTPPGALELTVIVQSTGQAPAIDSVSLDVALPTGGTVFHTAAGELGTRAIGFASDDPAVPELVELLLWHGGELVLTNRHFHELQTLDTDPLDVTSSVRMADGSLVVAGEVGDDAEIRLYRQGGGLWHRYWAKEIKDARVLDVAETSDGHIVAAGDKRRLEAGDAAVWQLTESGALLHSVVFPSENEDAHFSGIHSIAVESGDQLFAGHASWVGKDDAPTRATIFSLEGTQLVPIFQDKDPSPVATSTWNALTLGPPGLVATGSRKGAWLFGHAGNFPQEISEGEGTALAWSNHHSHVVGGRDGDGNLRVHTTRWDFLGETGEVRSLLVDPHGYVHVAGVSNDRAFVLTLNP